MKRSVVVLAACVVAATLLAVAAPPSQAVPAASPGLLVGVWGLNGSGQLGNGGIGINRAHPVESGVAEGTAIAGGQLHSLVVKADGTVWASGSNYKGQLGDGTNTDRNSPVQVSGLTGVVAVAAGYEFSVALKSNGTVWTWGDNSSGQLGDGTTTSRIVPGQVTGLSNVTAIAAGGFHVLALVTGGGVRAWGANTKGQLGDGSTTNRSTPITPPALTTGITAVSANYLYSLALRSSDGGVYAWGDNVGAQLGDGTHTAHSLPALVSGLTGATRIAAGKTHALAIVAGGALRAWGTNTQGQLGDSSNTERTTPVAVTGLTGMTAVAAGASHSMALGPDGAVWTFGYDFMGQLGDSAYTNRNEAYQIPNMTGATTIAAGDNFSMTLAPPGLLRVVTSPPVPSQISIDGVISDSWGVAYVKVLPGDHTVSFSHVEGFTEPVPVAAQVMTGATTTATGTFVPRTSLRVITSPATPATIYLDGVPRNDWGMWTDVPAGAHIVCFGAVVDLATPACQTFTLTAGSPMTITGTYTSSPGSLSSQLIGAWGQNTYGQLGNGTVNGATSGSLTAVGSGEATAIAAGPSFTVALQRDKTVRAWGNNANGQLGVGFASFRETAATVVSGLSNVTAVATGLFHGLALKADGSVWAWGNNGNGQLGDGTNTQRTTAVQVSGLTSGVVAIAAGWYHSLALMSDGSVRAWGQATDGQVGDGANVNRTTPVTVTGLSGVTAIDAGAYHSLALLSDGTVRSWGKNTNGQLGNTSTTPSNVPVTVSGLSGVTAVSGGNTHTLALKSDGSMVAWGDNTYGQIGDFTNTQRSSPVAVTGLSGVTSIAAGGSHSLALKADGTVWAWGYNAYGQLGDGTQTNRKLPVATPLASVTAISAGEDHSVALAPPGYLRVVTSPAVPSQVLIGGQIADSWGAYRRVFPAAYTVSFTHVEGFTEPAPITSTVVVAGATTTVTGTFTPRGSLHVVTSPGTAGTIYVDGFRRDDWGMWTDIPTGSHAVCFGTVVGKTAPVCQTISVSAGAPTDVTGSYT